MSSPLQRRPLVQKLDIQPEKPHSFCDDDLLRMADEVIDQVEMAKSEQGWVTTFGDLMTLLLVFFVMLFAMSEIKMQKFIELSESLQQGFGGSKESLNIAVLADSTSTDSLIVGIQPDEIDHHLVHITELLEQFIIENQLGGLVEVEKTNIGVTLKIQDLVLFDEASADLRIESIWIAEKLSKIVNEIAIPVIISGHTDSKPINTDKFPSNWELSGARASTLARLYLSNGLDPLGIHIEGYAEQKPVASNETAEGRAKNRRVELLYTRQNVVAKIIELANIK